MISFIFLYTFDTFLNGLVIALFAIFIVLMARVLYNKLYKKPIISLKLNKKRRWTKEKHFRGEDHSDSNKEFNEVHIFFNITCHFELIVRNLSRANAYNVKLLQLKESKNFELASGEIHEDIDFEFIQKKVLPFNYTKKVRVIREDKDKYFTAMPEEFNELTLLIEYSNGHNKLFHRKYFFKNDKTIDSPMSEEELDQWDYI